MQVHFHRDTKSSITDIIVRATIPPADYIVLSRYFHTIRLRTMVVTARRIPSCSVAGVHGGIEVVAVAVVVVVVRRVDRFNVTVFTTVQ